MHNHELFPKICQLRSRIAKQSHNARLGLESVYQHFMTTPVRIPKKQYYLQIAQEVATRATCMSAHFGSLIVKDDQIISTGYNGAPRMTKDCYEIGFCLRRKLQIPSGTQYEMCRSVHAEQNAIIQASLHGIPIQGSTIYITNQPCIICAKMLINAGIVSVVILDGYPDEMAMDFLKQAKIKIKTVKK